MRVQNYDGSEAKRILTGMIVDPIVLGRIAGKWEDKLFENSWCNLIGSWCVNYFRKHRKAPKRDIEALFNSWARRYDDKNTTELVGKFLSQLSGQYKRLAKGSNSEFVIDTAGEYFNRVRLKRLSEEIGDGLEGGEVNKLIRRVGSFGKLEMGVGAGIDVLSNKEAVINAFKAKRKPLIEYPGALGNFFGDSLERDGFIALMGPEKRGKSWWLIELAWTAMRQGKKVAFFEVGDMSQNQIMLRFMARAARHSIKRCTAKVPVWIEREGDSKIAAVEHKLKKFPKKLNLAIAWRALQQVKKKYGGQIRLACYPNSTLNVDGLKSQLQVWQQYDEETKGSWVPDVIVIDYVDIMAPLPGYTESRDQINSTWKALRALSQINHCLVITATQSDAGSYEEDVILMKNFSEDKRKYGHVTGMVGINQRKAEKTNGVYRLNWVVRREAEFSADQCVHVAGCLALANPAIRSTF